MAASTHAANVDATFDAFDPEVRPTFPVDAAKGLATLAAFFGRSVTDEEEAAFKIGVSMGYFYSSPHDYTDLSFPPWPQELLLTEQVSSATIVGVMESMITAGIYDMRQYRAEWSPIRPTMDQMDHLVWVPFFLATVGKELMMEPAETLCTHPALLGMAQAVGARQPTPEEIANFAAVFTPEPRRANPEKVTPEEMSKGVVDLPPEGGYVHAAQDDPYAGYY